MTSSQLLTLYGKVKNVAKREGGTACKGRGQIRPTGTRSVAGLTLKNIKLKIMYYV
jgi:hypothetical protein